MTDEVKRGVRYVSRLRLPTWLRRPTGLVDQTRRLFTASVLLSLAISMPTAFASGTWSCRFVIAMATVALALSWSHRYRTGSAPALLDAADVIAVCAFVSASLVPFPAFGFIFASIWFRAVFGARPRVLVYAFGNVTALGVSMLIWPLMPGHAEPSAVEPIVGAFPVILLTAAVARHLARGLYAREQAQWRDAALAGLGSNLLGITDRTSIYDHARQTVHALCAATPGLCAAILLEAKEGLVVQSYGGAFPRVPEVFPWSAVTRPPRGATETVALHIDQQHLARATGFATEWRLLPLPEVAAGWILLGAPSRLPEEGVIAFQSLTNQVGLALRNSDAHRHLREQAMTDALTGIANRAAFHHGVEASLEAGASVAVLFLDLDDFKLVNDAMGHHAGDEVLRHVADRIRSDVSPPDLCARLGGDEFAILLEGVSQAEAEAVGRRLVQQLTQTVALHERMVRVGVSVGIILGDPSMTSEQILQHADMAMYAAKGAGKNCVRTFSAGSPAYEGARPGGAGAPTSPRPRRPTSSSHA